SKEDADQAGEAMTRGWTPPTAKSKPGATNAAPSAPATQEGADEAELVPIADAPFLVRRLGLGTVVATHAYRGARGRPLVWEWLFNSLGPGRWQWNSHWGLSLERENRQFNDFLIPGVGLAPVVSFQVMITLFMLAIGPMNYLVL